MTIFRAFAKSLRSIPFLLHRAVSTFGRRAFRTASPSPEKLEEVHSILAIRLDAIGDLLMTTPALRAIRRKFPQAELHLLVQPGPAALARTLLWIDRVDTLPAQFLLRGKGPLGGVIQWAYKLIKLRRRRYDMILDFTSLFHSAAATWLIGAPLRLGFRRRLSLGYFQSEGFGHFYTHEFEANEKDHVADQMNVLASALRAEIDGGGWEVGKTPEMVRDAERVLDEAGIGPGDGPLVVVHPGAKWPPRQWSESGFSETIDLLQDRGWRALVNGGPGEKKIIEKIRRTCRTSPVLLWPPVSLETVIGLLEKADAFLGNDSGLMHMAAAVGTPVVAIFGPTLPARSGPRGSSLISLYASLDCSPCQLYFTKYRCHRGHNFCMDSFRPSAVAAAVELAADKKKTPRRAFQSSPR